jgi:DNA-binding HxlR family transcriptional regulator
MATMSSGPAGGASALEFALTRVGDRWSLLIIEALLDGPRRFTDLSELVPDIAPNILTVRLRRLEREGIVISRAYQSRPARREYLLSEDGAELAGVLRLLAAWGAAAVAAGSAEGVRHLACGSQLEARWYCPTCARTVDDDDTSTLSYA